MILFSPLLDEFQISLMTVIYIVKGCCSAINDRLQNMFIELPNSREKWLEISRKFEQRWNYPHALGAIDKKHVRVVKSNNGGSYFYNYKHTSSITLLAIVGSKYECLYADAHCLKSVRIRSYSGPHFPAFGLNTERYGVSLRIQSELGKIRTRITPNTDML